jgi:hypothetical protein
MSPVLLLATVNAFICNQVLERGVARGSQTVRAAAEG